MPLNFQLFQLVLADTPIAYLVSIPIIAFGWSLHKISTMSEYSDTKLNQYRWIGIFLSLIIGMIWVVSFYSFKIFFFRYDLGLLLWGIWSIAIGLVFWGYSAFRALRIPVIYLLLGWPPLYITIINWVNPFLSFWSIHLLNVFIGSGRWIRYTGSGIYSVISNSGSHVLVSVSYACSGSDSVMAMLVLFPVLYILMKVGFSKKVGLLLLSGVLVFLLNVVRIILIFLSLHWVGYQFAFNVVHPLLGPIFFVIVIFLLSIFALRSTVPTSNVKPKLSLPNPSLWQIVALLSIAIITSIALSPIYWQPQLIPVEQLV